MSKENEKYGVKPEVLKKIKWTKRDKELTNTDPKILIQGVVATPPAEWDEDQLWKAKKFGLNKMNAEQLRHLFDTEISE